ncbi:Holliday junction branch migration protein RuvA [Microcella daejeonensis]|uniref:Holliday junction branch migration protein RuvA n=1 Tax=Microcella daejeonensis TaxID=2994971 RepID=UPI0022701AA8|nr:Holliday junction branch migration protein RuvA [Microcella daejeonensis]WAB83338.1 Holliday junction branch migration protein RuvA [Microcella daejeonensis]
MIASLRGTLVSLGQSRAVVEVNGIGYAVSISERHALELRLGETVQLRTAMIVREDDISLFGFVDELELGLFELLRTVGGVGPKSALGVLGQMEPAAIAHAIAAGDDAPFRKVTGIGPKTAKLIVVTLAGKVVAPAGPTPARGAPAPSASARTAAALVEALTGLGWPERSAIEAAETVLNAEAGAESQPLPALLRRALAELGPRASRPDDRGARS